MPNCKNRVNCADSPQTPPNVFGTWVHVVEGLILVAIWLGVG